MHENVISKSKEMFNMKEIRNGYVLFLFLASVVSFIVLFAINIFNFIPIIGPIICLIGGIVFKNMFYSFMDVSTYKAFEDNRAPKFKESFDNARLEDSNTLSRWFLLPVVFSVVVGVCLFLVYLIPIWIISGLIMMNLYTAVSLMSIAFIIFNIVITCYLTSAFNYIYFFLVSDNFSNLTYIEVIKKSASSMKGHNTFYIMTIIKRALPIIIVMFIATAFFVGSLGSAISEGIALAGGVTAYSGFDTSAALAGSMVFSSVFFLFAVIFSWVYSLFFVTPYIKMFSYNLFKENLKGEI